MEKKRARHTNPEPSLADTDSKSKKRTKAPNNLKEKPTLSYNMSSKILKEALLQQKEIQDEESKEQLRNPDHHSLVFKGESSEEEDIDDDYKGFSETQSIFGSLEDEFDVDQVDDEDEKLLEAFFGKGALADTIIGKIKEKDAQVYSKEPALPKLDDSFLNLYNGVGKLLSKYTSGKIPKAFKHIPSQQCWEELLYLTEPENWSPHAMYEATKIFSSNLCVEKAERFYKVFLLPRVRDDIRKNKSLHTSLCQAVKKSLYKPEAFYKGILFPLCESRTCTLREAVIIGSIIYKMSIPPCHSRVALLKLCEMEYSGTTSYLMKRLIEKKYQLPYSVLDAMVTHFMRFANAERTMPVIWHLTLLAFVQRYKNGLRKEDKVNLINLVDKQRHKLITPEILRELKNSHNRGEKDDLIAILTPVSAIHRTIEEDRFDIPDVPMEED